MSCNIICTVAPRLYAKATANPFCITEVGHTNGRVDEERELAVKLTVQGHNGRSRPTVKNVRRCGAQEHSLPAGRHGMERARTRKRNIEYIKGCTNNRALTGTPQEFTDTPKNREYSTLAPLGQLCSLTTEADTSQYICYFPRYGQRDQASTGREGRETVYLCHSESHVNRWVRAPRITCAVSSAPVAPRTHASCVFGLCTLSQVTFVS